MTIENILSKVDHTNLKQTATWEDIRNLCEEGIKYKVASICIPPSYVKRVKNEFGDEIKICTVIGFPNGYATTETKIFETDNAIKNGADEIDMVINIGWLKDRRYDDLLQEINKIKDACGDKILKVIIETCLLTDDEKVKMCEIVQRTDADYIKTSTGFSTSGATIDDIKLFKGTVKGRLKIKAAGGIQDTKDAEEFIRAGADRLGTSRVIKCLK